MTVRFVRSFSVGGCSRLGIRAGMASLLVLAGAGSVKDAAALNETRTLSFHHTHSNEDLTITFKRNGRYDEAALKTLNHYLRDWRSQEQTTMDRHLFDILWEVYRDVDGKQPIQIISSYRSPSTNAMLRRRSAHSGVARFSQHMLGHAMDFYIPGVPLASIRAAGLRLQRGGVGFYPTSGSPFVHLDTGNVRHWPRMTHDQLARVFPNGRTVHIPSDGKPLAGYAVALAEVQRRRASNSDDAPATGKSFLASLFGSKAATTDDEDEAPAAAARPVRDREVADATPDKPSPAKPAESVPLPRLRPAASFQVASAESRPVSLGGGSASDAKPQTVADIINSRGFWGDEPAKAKPATTQQIAMLKARMAVATPGPTAAAREKAASDAIKAAGETEQSADQPLDGPWTGERPSAAVTQALAYAPANSEMFDRSQIVTASAPIPRSIRPASASRNPMAMKPDTVAVKGVQPIPGGVVHAMAAPAKLARLGAAKTGNGSWLRAMILAPNVYSYMLPTAFGDQDMTQMRDHFVKPQMTVVAAFSNDATPGIICERFTGTAIGTLTTVSFPVQTAALR